MSRSLMVQRSTASAAKLNRHVHVVLLSLVALALGNHAAMCVAFYYSAPSFVIFVVETGELF